MPMLIRSLLQAERDRVIEEVRAAIEPLDYYWQREHQDKVLVRLDDVLAALDGLGKDKK